MIGNSLPLRSRRFSVQLDTIRKLAGRKTVSLGMALLFLSGCASNPYRYGTGRIDVDTPNSPTLRQQIYVGRPNAFLDASDWIWPGSLLGKLLLWDKDVDSHQIDDATITHLQTYIDENRLSNVEVLVNAYMPGNQWSRLFKNRTVGAGWRYTLGILSVTLYTILPGRFFGGDAYNPYTNTVYLYSNDTSVALHEGGHAKDFGRREYKGTHAAVYALPFASLYYEARASNEALGYLRCQQNNEEQKDAYKILYPAYSTYVGGNMSQWIIPNPLWYLTVIPGHIAGQIAAANVDPEDKALTAETPTGERIDVVEGCSAPLNL
jgi:hypothetical protein